MATVEAVVGRFWEPWEPKQGQVVRIRISPECKAHHRRHQDGRLGEVIYVWPLDNIEHEAAGQYNGHRIFVDTGLWLRGVGWYASGELEPVEK